MKVFISWSGQRSRHVAEALRNWLPYVIQEIQPWMSAADIPAGARWSSTIDAQLAATSFGILCLTRANRAKPWILFEAGALAKSLSSDTFVCPYLIDFRPEEMEPGPLTLFQAAEATEADTWKLVLGINQALKERQLPEPRLKGTFAKFWPELADALSNLPGEAAPEEKPAPTRAPEAMLAEAVVTMRELARLLKESPVVRDGWRTAAPEELTERMLAGLALSPENRARLHSLVVDDSTLAGRMRNEPPAEGELDRLLSRVFSAMPRIEKTDGPSPAPDPQAGGGDEEPPGSAQERD